MKIKIDEDRTVHCPYATTSCNHPTRCIRMIGQECYLYRGNNKPRKKYLRRIKHGKN